MIYISSNNVRHPVTMIFTPLHPTTLHYTCWHFTSSHLNFTQLYCTTLSFGLIPFKLPTAPFHITTLHLTSLHCLFRWFSPHFYSSHFILFIIAFLTLFLKILGLQWKVPNTSAGSWFQFLMFIFSCPVHGLHLVTSGLRTIVRAAAHLQTLLANSFHRQFSYMFSLCLLTVCGLFTNSKKMFDIPGFPLEMENQVKSLHVLTY